MIDRRLWDEEEGDELERELLRSMRADAPSPEARRRMLATLGLVGVGTAMAPTAVAAEKGVAAALASKGAHALLTKGGLVLLGVGLGAVAATVALGRPAPAPAAAPPPVVSAAASAPAPSIAAVEPAAPSAAPQASIEAVASVAPKPSASASITEAIALLDAARKALDGGDVADAIARLDRYDARFPKGPLRPEADLLRIECLVRRGDRAAARALADALAMKLPGSAHAQRARDLVDATTP